MVHLSSCSSLQPSGLQLTVRSIELNVQLNRFKLRVERSTQTLEFLYQSCFEVLTFDSDPHLTRHKVDAKHENSTFRLDVYVQGSNLEVDI